MVASTLQRPTSCNTNRRLGGTVFALRTHVTVVCETQQSRMGSQRYGWRAKGANA
jgi:hypothetical protein